MSIGKSIDLFSFLFIDLDFQPKEMGLRDTLLHLSWDILKFILVQNSLPVLFTEWEPWTDSVSLVNVLRVYVERAPVSSHYDVLFLPQDEVLFTIDLKPNINLASVEVKNFIEVIELIV